MNNACHALMPGNAEANAGAQHATCHRGLAGAWQAPETAVPCQEGSKLERRNFWGYSTAAFTAPMARYSSDVAAGRPGGAACAEFKRLVRECHKRGIEVVADIVLNHTAEGNQQGPYISLRWAHAHHGLSSCSHPAVDVALQAAFAVPGTASCCSTEER